MLISVPCYSSLAHGSSAEHIHKRRVISSHMLASSNTLETIHSIGLRTSYPSIPSQKGRLQMLIFYLINTNPCDLITSLFFNLETNYSSTQFLSRVLYCTCCEKWHLKPPHAPVLRLSDYVQGNNIPTY